MSYPRVPDSLLPQMIWRPIDDDGHAPAIVYLVDRRRRRETVAAACAATLLSLISAFIFSAAGFLPVIGAAAALLLYSLIRYRNGRSGFYQLTEAGQVGTYLGRVPPDLAGYRRQRLHGKKGKPWVSGSE